MRVGGGGGGGWWTASLFFIVVDGDSFFLSRGRWCVIYSHFERGFYYFGVLIIRNLHSLVISFFSPVKFSF